MITKVKVVSRDILNKIVSGSIKMPYDVWYLISICNGNGNLAFTNIYNNSTELLNPENIYDLMQKGMQDGISLRFDDCSPEMQGGCTLFSSIQAKKIISFLNKIKSGKDGVLIVHCAAGISRSGAVGEFANDFFQLEYSNFKKENPQVNPNAHVKSVLRKEAGYDYY